MAKKSIQVYFIIIVRITPVNFNRVLPSYQHKSVLPDKYDLEISDRDIIQKDLNPEPIKVYASNVLAFGSSHYGDGDVLKELLAYKIPDIYSGIIMINPKELEYLLASKAFSQPIVSVIASIQHLEKSMLPTEKKVFRLIKNAAKNAPQKYLDQIISKLYPEHYELLMAQQRPIFDELRRLAKQMPLEQQEEFNRFMQVIDTKLNNKMQVVPFSAKEFRYKLQRIEERISRKKVKSEQKAMQQLVAVSYELSDSKSLISQATAKNSKKTKREIAARGLLVYNANILRKMSEMLVNSPLKDDKELNDLLYNAKAGVYGIPMAYRFGRKSFIHNLQKITDKLQDQKLAHKMIQTARQLPTSRESVSAFIVKTAFCSPEKIGYELLYPSLGTIEHLQPTKSGGPNTLDNLALASKALNNERAHRTFERQLTLYPETYENCQKYADRLIQLYKSGVFRKVGLSKWYIINFARKMSKMSPKSKPLILDLKKLH